MNDQEPDSPEHDHDHDEAHEAPPPNPVDPGKLAAEAAGRRKELPLLQRIVKHFSKDRETYRELVINSETLEKRVALLNNGVLERFELEHRNENRMVGAIFKGRVQNLEGGLKAALSPPSRFWTRPLKMAPTIRFSLRCSSSKRSRTPWLRSATRFSSVSLLMTSSR